MKILRCSRECLLIICSGINILLTNYMYLLSTRQITPFEAKMFLIDQLDSPPVANIRLVAYPLYEMFRRVYTSIY